MEEALALAERKADFNCLAGKGPWSQLGDEAMRLQILNAIGRWGKVLKAVEKHLERFETIPEKSNADESVVSWNVRETILNTGVFAAKDLEKWETALALNAEKAKSEKARGAGKIETAMTLYNDYGPLLKLGRLVEARRLLETCRDAFSQERHYILLGKTYSAMADLENKEMHQDAAVLFGKIALQYIYRYGQPEDCAIRHDNLSIYLQRAGEPRDAWLAHRLAAGITSIRIGSGHLRTVVRNLAISDLPDTPPAFDRIAATVEQIDGVRFRELFARLPARYSDGDAAVAAVWQMARKEKNQR